MTESSDEELMALYQNGAEAAFRILYERHSAKIYNYLQKRVVRKEKVTEIYQDVFVKLHKSKSLYNLTLPLLPWLFTITRSVLIDEFKKDKNFKYNDNFDLEKIPAALPADCEQHHSEVGNLIQSLPEAQKKVVQLRYVDEKTFAEIAEILKTTPLNVRQILSRGIKRLKQLIIAKGLS